MTKYMRRKIHPAKGRIVNRTLVVVLSTVVLLLFLAADTGAAKYIVAYTRCGGQPIIAVSKDSPIGESGWYWKPGDIGYNVKGLVTVTFCDDQEAARDYYCPAFIGAKIRLQMASETSYQHNQRVQNINMYCRSGGKEGKPYW